ncbi:MAG: chorismate-binding protein, partial [Acidiferrobacterales bacterium]|nr:chorismate-binding protein [Acidiferrobacterales bacterium]
LVGYFGYETVEYIEPKLADISKAAPKPDPIEAPDIMLMVSEDVLVFDNLSGRIYVVTLVDLNQDEAFSAAQTRLDNSITGLTKNFTPPSYQACVMTTEADAHKHFQQADFESAVQACRDYIEDGDIMQVVLSQRMSVDYIGHSLDLYRALRTINPSPYMYFLNLGDFQVVGSSPEILVRLQDDTVTVRPIAGTRKRGKDAEHDLQLQQELLADEKETAEHLMLIDLGRNDVGRIAKIGSVDLTEKMLIERYSHVMHIVSNVDAELDKNFDAIDVLKATFPAGTVSGAPKIRAMEIIAEFEPVKRGVYSGAVGYLGWNGNMDTAIAIRTAVIKDQKLYIQAGAGIVADSVPEYEWKETMSKARALFSALKMVSSGIGG